MRTLSPSFLQFVTPRLNLDPASRATHLEAVAPEQAHLRGRGRHRAPGAKELNGAGPAPPRQAAEPEPQPRSREAAARLRLRGARQPARRLPAAPPAQALRSAEWRGDRSGPKSRGGGAAGRTRHLGQLLHSQRGSRSPGAPDRAGPAPMASAACPGPGDPAM